MNTKVKLQDKERSFEGHFSLIGRDKDGNIKFHFEDHNMIVIGAKTSLAKLISDPTADASVVTKVGVGVNGISPTPEDTDLTGEYVKLIDQHTYPDVGQVTFHWTLGLGEANGMEIREFGLFTADETLFARKVRGVIEKEDDLSLEGEWTIIF